MPSPPTIIISLFLLANSALAATMQESVKCHPFLAPLAVSIKPLDIIKAFDTRFFEVLGTEIISGSNLSKTLKHVLTFKQAKLLVTIGAVTKDEVVSRLVSLFSRYTPRQVEMNEMGFNQNLEDLLTQFARSHLKHSNFAATDFNSLVPSDYFIEAFAQMEVQQKWTFAESVDRRRVSEYVVARKRKSMNAKTQFIQEYTDFMTDPKKHLSEFLVSYCQYIGSQRGEGIKAYDAVLTDVLAILAKLGDELNLFNIAKVLAVHRLTSLSVNPRVLLDLGMKIATAFATYKERKQLLVGVEALFLFFPVDNYPVLAPEFKDFLAKHYRWFRKFYSTFKDDESVSFERQMKTLDLLVVIKQMPEDYISVEELQSFLTNAPLIGRGMKQVNVQMLADSKKLFERTMHLIPEHPELYADLYNTTISFACYASYRSWNEQPRSIFEKFDFFVNYAQNMHWSEANDNSIIAGAPMESALWNSFYPPSVERNYFFYKALAVLEWVENPAWDMRFHKFEKSDNWLIHKFLLEPAVKPTLKRLQTKVRKSGGYNYHVFSDVKIEADWAKEFGESVRRRAQFIKTNDLN